MHFLRFIHKNIVAVIAATLLLSSCNEDVDQFAAIMPPAAGNTIAKTIAANASDSLFYRLMIRAGAVDKLNDSTGARFTVLVPDNAAMIASGLNSVVVNNIPVAQAAAIVNYNIIPQKLDTAAIARTFPNMQLPTNIILDQTNPLVRMTTSLSKNGTQAYANNIPLGQVNVQAQNGVIHKPLRLVAPPAATLKTLIAAEADLSIFRAAVTRADEGQTGLSRFDSLLNYGVTNMTVLAPNNNAFKGLINILSGGMVPLNAPDAVFINFISRVVPAADIRGIIAHHLLATPNAF